MKIWGFERDCFYAFEVVAERLQMKVVREKVSSKWKSKELCCALNQGAETSKLSGLSYRTFTLSNGKFNIAYLFVFYIGTCYKYVRKTLPKVRGMVSKKT